MKTLHWHYINMIMVLGFFFSLDSGVSPSKVDGILVMYDITAEDSFMAVRNWMTCVQVRIDCSERQMVWCL